MTSEISVPVSSSCFYGKKQDKDGIDKIFIQ